ARHARLGARPVPSRRARSGLPAPPGAPRRTRAGSCRSPVSRDVYYVDGLRTAFGRAGPKGIFWRTRAADMAVKAVRELLRRNSRVAPERLVDPSAVTMGATAENLHDRFPHSTKEDADAFAVCSQRRAAAAWENGVMHETVVPMSVFTDEGWRVADRDEFLRPDTTLEGLAGLRTPFRAGGRVTAGNSAGLTDGATACLLAAEETAAELGLEPRMRLIAFAFAGVEP